MIHRLPKLIARLPDHWRWGLAAWLVARLSLSGWGALLWSLNIIPLQPNADFDFYFGLEPIREGWRGAILGVWQRWDAIHYIRLAEAGYGQRELAALFPLYPLLGRLMNLLTAGDTILSLIIVSNTALVLALVLLYQIVAQVDSSGTAKRTVVVTVLYPTAFYFAAPYAESLSLFLALLAFWAARRSMWLLTAIAGMAAGLTHSTMLLLVGALVWEAWSQWRASEQPARLVSLVAALTPALGAGLFFAWRIQQGFLPYTELQYELWGWHFQLPWQTLKSLPLLFRTSFFFMIGWANAIAVLLAIVTTVWGARHLPRSLFIYQASLLVLLLLTTRETEPLASWGRHSLPMFPIFIALAAWLRTARRKLAGLLVGATVHLYLAGAFFIWGWTG